MASNDRKGLSKSDKEGSSRKKGMTASCEAQNLLRDAFPVRRYGKVEAAFYEAHKFISRRVRKDFTMRRVRAIWEGKARRIDSEEMDALRLAKIEETRREQKELRARLAALDEMLANVDAALAGASVAREGERLRGARGMDRSGA